ncbi:MAG TPA: DUF559 domain-containing protein [Alphaproteobacteria bacterium]|nr:endonuclease domain-containing protein [Alphaproteobacteria bacterium]HOO51602.1 DUF559 domain-containing protein [Alphaproteobacteria bacterium]
MKLTSFSRYLRKNPTDAEAKLWRYIRLKQIDGHKFRRQQNIDNRYIVDFVCLEKRLIIELDGGQHTKEIDRKRTEYVEQQGFEILRFWNNEVMENIEGVLLKILEKLKE